MCKIFNMDCIKLIELSLHILPASIATAVFVYLSSITSITQRAINKFSYWAIKRWRGILKKHRIDLALRRLLKDKSMFSSYIPLNIWYNFRLKHFSILYSRFQNIEPGQTLQTLIYCGTKNLFFSNVIRVMF